MYVMHASVCVEFIYLVWTNETRIMRQIRRQHEQRHATANGPFDHCYWCSARAKDDDSEFLAAQRKVGLTSISRRVHRNASKLIVPFMPGHHGANGAS